MFDASSSVSQASISVVLYILIICVSSAYDSERAALIAIHDVRVEFFGKASHASAAPWEGKLLRRIH